VTAGGWNEDDLPRYEEEDEDEFGPGSADYDLSEEHGYMWEPKREQIVPRWVLVVVSIVVIIALVLPSILFVMTYR
jgi:hypothetical protein